MKNLAWLAAFALLLGCGDVDTESAPAGEELDTRVIDLREDGEAQTVVAGAVGVNGGPQIVRRTGERVAFAVWRDSVLDHHGFDIGAPADDLDMVIVPDPDREMTDEEAMRNFVEDSRTNKNRCPAGCLHCPEDYGFLCFSMCGGR